MNVAQRDILSILKERNLSNVSTISMIYNARTKLRMVEQVGNSPMQVLMAILHSNNCVYEFSTTGSNELENLFFVHPKSFNTWRAFPHVLIIDAMYKTNYYNKQSKVGRKIWLRKLKNIFSPRTTDIQEPQVQKNTRGRPKKSQQKGRAEFCLARHSCSAMPNFADSVKESARHSCFEFDLNDYLIEQISEIFRRYIISIYNVRGDGNCGFRFVAHGIGQHEDRWHDVRLWLLQELDTNSAFYISMWWQNDFNHLRRSVDWFDNGFALRDYWMSMPNTGLVIASVINRPVVFISERQSHTCFPFFSGPDLSQGTGPLVIARVGDDECAHFIYLTLDENSPVPDTHPQWRAFIVADASEWTTLYYDRQHLYTEIRQRQT